PNCDIATLDERTSPPVRVRFSVPCTSESLMTAPLGKRIFDGVTTDDMWVSPAFSIAVAAVTGLNVDPGSYENRMSRDARSAASDAAGALGSTDAVSANARIFPVATSMTMTP